jgi:antitoxin ParD1/3/4
MRELTVTLPDDLAELVRQKVDSGEYNSESEVVRAALRTLADDFEPGHGPEIEEWLRNEVVPTHDAVDADPSRVLTIEQVEAKLDARYQRLLKDPAG